MAAKGLHLHVKLDGEIERCRAEGQWAQLRHLAQQLLPPARPPRKATAGSAQDAGKRRAGRSRAERPGGRRYRTARASVGSACRSVPPPGARQPRPGGLMRAARAVLQCPGAAGEGWGAAAEGMGCRLVSRRRRPGPAAGGRAGSGAAGAREPTLREESLCFLLMSARPSPRGCPGKRVARGGPGRKGQQRLLGGFCTFGVLPSPR